MNWMLSLMLTSGAAMAAPPASVDALAQDYMPSAWGYYRPTWVDICMLIGSFGLFLTLFLLFIRYLPVVAIAEVKGVMPQAKPHPEEPGTAVHGDYQGSAKVEEGLA